MDDVDPAAGEFFAWCFSHGGLHRFTAEPWCTAAWVPLSGATEAAAMEDKQARFGEPLFLHHLSMDIQAEILGLEG